MVRNSRANQSGASTVEYAVLLAFLSFVLIGAVTQVGLSARDKICYTGFERDINGDGTIQASDAGVINAYGATHGPNSYDRRLDVNCDGKIIVGANANSDEQRLIQDPNFLSDDDDPVPQTGDFHE